VIFGGSLEIPEAQADPCDGSSICRFLPHFRRLDRVLGCLFRELSGLQNFLPKPVFNLPGGHKAGKTGEAICDDES
jgi:hypothetical protein